MTTHKYRAEGRDKEETTEHDNKNTYRERVKRTRVG